MLAVKPFICVQGTYTCNHQEDNSWSWEDLESSSSIQSPWSLISPAKTGPAVWKGIKVKEHLINHRLEALPCCYQASKITRWTIPADKTAFNYLEMFYTWRLVFILDFVRLIWMVGTFPNQKKLYLFVVISPHVPSNIGKYSLMFLAYVFWSLEIMVFDCSALFFFLEMDAFPSNTILLELRILVSHSFRPLKYYHSPGSQE